MAADHRSSLVVIGSGWVGLYIDQYIDTKKYAVTIISPRRTSAYTPLLASAAVGLFPFSCAEESLRIKGRDTKYIKAKVVGIDLDADTLHCEPAFEEDAELKKRAFDVKYDKLIIAPGCETNTFGTPGVAEHALFMKHVTDAMSLRKMLFDQLEKASLPCVSRDEAAGLLHVAIVGGGPIGVEITAELSDLAKKELEELYPTVAPLLKISLFDVAPNILGSYEKELYQYATERIAEQGVEIQTSTVIEKVDKEHLHIKDKGEIPYGILLWVTGNKSVSLVEDLNVRKSKKGLIRILTDASLRVLTPDESGEVYENVFALGDAADIEDNSLPTTAEVAVQKAKHLVRSLNRGIDVVAPEFKYSGKRLVTYIGQRDGVSQGSDGNSSSGQEAWLSWRSGSFTWTRTWRNWVAIMQAGLLNLLFGKDVIRL